MKVFFETYGCAHNQADTERMKDYVTTTNKIEDADKIIINTCAVKDRTVKNLRQRINFLKRTFPNKEIILTGCLTQAESLNDFKELPILKDHKLFGTNTINNIDEVIESKENIKLINLKKQNPGISEAKNIVKTIPISTGCLNSCTYCQTKLARGVLKSYSIDYIKDKIINSNPEIIYLTSQDNACYGYDLNQNLPNLLKEILALDKDFKLRIGMANPKYLKDYFDELLEVMDDPRIFKFLHIPIQSGSNKVLEHMGRENTAEEFIDLVNKARSKFPDITIATDIIVAYPSETEEDFQDTLDLLKTTKPDVINRSNYSPRPKTEAAKLKQIDKEIVKERSKQLKELVETISLKKNNLLLNKEFEVIVDAKKQNNSVMARNESYKPIILKSDYDLGEKLRVKIIKANTYYLEGEVYSLPSRISITL